jgi:hypothetical protein
MILFRRQEFPEKQAARSIINSKLIKINVDKSS